MLQFNTSLLLQCGPAGNKQEVALPTTEKETHPSGMRRSRELLDTKPGLGVIMVVGGERWALLSSRLLRTAWVVVYAVKNQ